MVETETIRADLTHVPLWVNRSYYSIFTSKTRYNVLYGGAGAGKSYAVAQRIVYDCASQSNRRWLVVRKVAKTLRHSCFALIRQIISEWKLAGMFSVHKSDMVISCPFTGSEILFVGLDDVEKLKSILDPSGIWVEETTEITMEDFTQLNIRLRGKDDSVNRQIFLTFNPISVMHWAKEYFFDDVKVEREKLFTRKYTYKDNQWLDEESKRVLENLDKVDPYFAAVYLHGEWGVLGNIVFHNYVIEDFEYTWDQLENRRIGMDFGYNDPSTVIMLGYKDNELYIYDELWVREKTNPELIELAKSFLKDIDISLTADNAEPARIREFNVEGIDVRASKKGKDSRSYGYDYIKAQKVHIHKNRCPYTANEFQTAKYREDKDGNVMDEVVEMNDHCLAAIRYATEDIWSYRMPTDWPVIPH